MNLMKGLTKSYLKVLDEMDKNGQKWRRVDENKIISDKSLTLMTFNIRHSTNGPMDQRTNGPMDQWTTGLMD